MKIKLFQEVEMPKKKTKKHSFFVCNDQRFNRIVATLVSMLRVVTFFLCKKPRQPFITFDNLFHINDRLMFIASFGDSMFRHPC